MASEKLTFCSTFSPSVDLFPLTVPPLLANSTQVLCGITVLECCQCYILYLWVNGNSLGIKWAACGQSLSPSCLAGWEVCKWKQNLAPCLPLNTAAVLAAQSPFVAVQAAGRFVTCLGVHDGSHLFWISLFCLVSKWKMISEIVPLALFQWYNKEGTLVRRRRFPQTEVWIL